MGCNLNNIFTPCVVMAQRWLSKQCSTRTVADAKQLFQAERAADAAAIAAIIRRMELRHAARQHPPTPTSLFFQAKGGHVIASAIEKYLGNRPLVKKVAGFAAIISSASFTLGSHSVLTCLGALGCAYDIAQTAVEELVVNDLSSLSLA